MRASKDDADIRMEIPDAAIPRRAVKLDSAQLGESFRGRVVTPESQDYDRARRVWNGAVDKRPAVIAYCGATADVRRALAFARARELPVAVRSGGHNIAGASVCENGLVIDLSDMKTVEVDPERRIARAAAGLTLGEFDAATQAFGLATTMGVNSDTGIAGLTLGGGFGKLCRKFGLSCDNLLSAEIVTADGHVLRASETENADLFWGIRGGGGNFGIVTAFEYRLHPVGPTILRASLSYDCDRARDAMRRYRDFAAIAADEVSADAGLSLGTDGKPIFSLSVCYVGASEEGADILRRLLAPLHAGVRAIDETIAATPYLVVQSTADQTFPRGRRYSWKAQFLANIRDEFIDVLLDAFPSAPSRRSIFAFQQVGGAISRLPRTATAYAHRDAAFDCFPVAIWDSPAEDEANIAWVRRLWGALRPFSTGGVYVNNLGDEGDDRIRAAYSANYSRLVSLKDKYDPDNVFRLNQNVQPGARVQGETPGERSTASVS